jgi:hypothetical protein
MDTGIRIINSQIVFAYRRNLNIRKRIFEFEDVLKNKFKVPFRPVTIPDEIEPNIPRFEAQSINDHSKLQVSQTSITLATSFDDQFKTDSSRIQSYLTDKYESLKGLAETEEVEFVAYIVELGVYKDSEELNRYLKAIGDDCKDFSLLYSKVYKGNYYLNVKISKFTEQQLTMHPETGGLRPTGKVDQGISIILDFNSRPYFEKNQKFEGSLHSDISQKIFELINSKSIEDYLKGELY